MFTKHLYMNVVSIRGNTNKQIITTLYALTKRTITIYVHRVRVLLPDLDLFF